MSAQRRTFRLMCYSSIGRWVRSRHGISTVVVTVLAIAVEARWGLRPATVLATPVFAAVATAVLAMWWDGRTVPETPPFAKPRAGADTRALREDPNAEIVTDRGGYLFARRH